MSELAGQIENLVELGTPSLVGLGEVEFRERLAPLADVAPDDGFAVVVRDVTPLAALALLRLDGKGGFTDLDAEEIARFEPIEGAEAPDAFAYLVAGVDLGAETLNVTPEDALPRIVGAGRSPLTIEEGLAILLQGPEVLRERNCFSLLGSRCGDRRVPALWVKADGSPRLGWCWNGAPHTWLGSASCATRLAAHASADRVTR